VLGHDVLAHEVLSTAIREIGGRVAAARC